MNQRGGGLCSLKWALCPDVAFIAKHRQAELVKSGYNRHPPNLAVEVLRWAATLDTTIQKPTMTYTFLS